MTAREVYRECERLFLKTDWSDPDSVNRYNEAVAKLKKQREHERKEDKK